MSDLKVNFTEQQLDQMVFRSFIAEAEYHIAQTDEAKEDAKSNLLVEFDNLIGGLDELHNFNDFASLVTQLSDLFQTAPDLQVDLERVKNELYVALKKCQSDYQDDMLRVFNSLHKWNHFRIST